MQSGEEASAPSQPALRHSQRSLTAPEVSNTLTEFLNTRASGDAANAAAATVPSAEEEVPGTIPALPPPGAPSPSAASSADAPERSQATTATITSKKSKKSVMKSKSKQFNEESSSTKNLRDSHDPHASFDLELQSHHSGLSRPSSQASHATDFSGLGNDDFMQKYKMMKLLLKEKEKELKAMQDKEMENQRPQSPKVFAQVFGRKTAQQKEEEQALVQPPDPAEILKQVRRRRFVVLVIIFAGMCFMPIFVLPMFKSEITP